MQELVQKRNKREKQKIEEPYQSHLFENYDVIDLLGAVSLILKSIYILLMLTMIFYVY